MKWSRGVWKGVVGVLLLAGLTVTSEPLPIEPDGRGRVNLGSKSRNLLGESGGKNEQPQE